MKLITEFSTFNLTKGLTAKTALTAEGKSAEEIEGGLGTQFKLEGEKLKYFVNALTVAEQNKENLKRVFVMTLAEGEKTPAKAVQVEEQYYVPEFLVEKRAAPAPDAKGGRGGRGGGGGRRDDSKKGSPWGMSPEELAAKKGKGKAPTAAN